MSPLSRLSGFTALILLCAGILFSAQNLYANPFFGSQGKQDVAPPPVYASGSGSFIKLQFEYREKIAEGLRNIKNGGKEHFVLMLLLVSFLYGIFHAAGPGHRKTIVFSLFISQEVKWYEPACAGFLSAGIHAGSSIILILILDLVQEAFISLSGTDTAYAYMEGITFVVLAFFALAFIIYKIISLRTRKESNDSSAQKRLYPLIIISSLVPCPGATMLLLLALYSGMLAYGIAGVIAMSLGMGIIISFAGYLAYAGRAGLFAFLKTKEHRLRMISSFLEIISFAIIFLFSAVMAWPFIRSII